MDDPFVKVGICSADTFSISFVNEYFIKSIGISLYGRYKISATDNAISISDSGDNEIYSSDSLYFSPVSGDNDVFEIDDVTIGIDFHWERKEKQRFQGELSVIREGDKVSLINIVPVEKYLKSVISSEMNADSPIEFLKAHAVISRSWLLSRLEDRCPEGVTDGMTDTDDKRIKWYGREEHINFDVCADDHCQRYQGITRIVNDRVDEVVKETEGVVLMYGEDICDARFSKCCGGVSEDFHNVWENKNVPYLSMIIDSDDSRLPAGPDDLSDEENAEKWIREEYNSYCNTNDNALLYQVLNDYDTETKDFYRWKVSYSQEELSELISRKTGRDFGKIIRLTPLSRGRSGRIIELKIEGTEHTMVIGKELEIRKVLSESHLFSSAFVTDYHDYQEEIPQRFTITGAGWGHGVGLCQIGAAVMARKGKDYKQILRHYFKGADLKKIY